MTPLTERKNYSKFIFHGIEQLAKSKAQKNIPANLKNFPFQFFMKFFCWSRVKNGPNR